MTNEKHEFDALKALYRRSALKGDGVLNQPLHWRQAFYTINKILQPTMTIAG